MRDNYTVALYIRLSAEDENDGESNSVKNQRDLLTAFVRREANLSGCTLLEFCDDGFSGVNFDRPKVKEMLEKVRKGMIQCIIVKDFSRFGRNYIEVGDYLVQVFPFLDVRFISVNDSYDSDKDYNSIGGIEVALRALIYDLYSKDLSQKVKSAKMSKLKKGEFLGGYAPFGYVKEEGKNQLLVDPEAAKIVRRMFDLAMSGIDAYKIAKILNDDMTPTKAQYKKHSKGYTTWDKRTIDIDNSFWTDTYVRKVIGDETYVGTVVSGKVRSQGVGSRRMKFNEEKPDVILLDVMMPHKNGFEVCKEIRQTSKVPILMVTARH
jgi:DNA invertase Pin-like site-specific DNA recombinase